MTQDSSSSSVAQRRQKIGHPSRSSVPGETGLDNLSESLLNLPVCHRFFIKRHSDNHCTIIFLRMPAMQENDLTFFIARIADSSGIIMIFISLWPELPDSIFRMEFYTMV